MFRWLDLLLLLLFFPVICNETTTVGTTPRSVVGGKGGNSTLPCEFEAREISLIRLFRLSKSIHVCENVQSENCKVFKEGSCDIVIKDLNFRDAGKYILRFLFKNVTNQGQETKTYLLQIHDEISLNTGEELKLDVLLTNAYKVEHQTNREWTVVWTRESNSSVNVTDERLVVRDGNLTIYHFNDNDTGTYRVLDSEDDILITVTVTLTESSEEHKDDPKNTVESWIIGLSVCVALVVVLALAVGIYFFWKHKRQHRNAGPEGYRDVPLQEGVGVSGAQPNTGPIVAFHTSQDDETTSCHINTI